MTLSTTTNRGSLDTDGLRTTFDYNFQAIGAESIVVYLVNKTTREATFQTAGVDYTLTINTRLESFTVGFPTAPLTGQEVLAIRIVPLTQLTDIPPVGAIREENLETPLDRLTAIAQQLNESISRALLLSISSTQTGLELPDLIGNAFLASDGSSLYFRNFDELGDVTFTGVPFGIEANLPATGNAGDLYLATDTNKIYLYRTSWSVVGVNYGAQLPATSDTGQLFYNSIEKRLYIEDGNGGWASASIPPFDALTEATAIPSSSNILIEDTSDSSVKKIPTSRILTGQGVYVQGLTAGRDNTDASLSSWTIDKLVTPRRRRDNVTLTLDIDTEGLGGAVVGYAKDRDHVNYVYLLEGDTTFGLIASRANPSSFTVPTDLTDNVQWTCIAATHGSTGFVPFTLSDNTLFLDSQVVASIDARANILVDLSDFAPRYCQLFLNYGTNVGNDFQINSVFLENGFTSAGGRYLSGDQLGFNDRLVIHDNLQLSLHSFGTVAISNIQLRSLGWDLGKDYLANNY